MTPEATDERIVVTTLEAIAYVDVEALIQRLPPDFVPDAIRIKPQLWFRADCQAEAETIVQLEALLLYCIKSRTVTNDEAQDVATAAPAAEPSNP